MKRPFKFSSLIESKKAKTSEGRNRSDPFVSGLSLIIRKRRRVVELSPLSSLIPLKDEGWERNLFPLFQIFRWEKDLQGGISTNLFWGFYKRTKKEEMDSWEVAHLMGLRRGRGWKELSFLQGLFRYESDGRTADLRLFYLPFHLRWSLSNPSSPP